MQFEFATATRILFGPGSISQVAQIAAQMANRVLLVTGRDTQRAQRLIKDLDNAGLNYTIYQTLTEPTIEMVSQATDLARRTITDLVIAMGGGSAIDLAKAVAAMLANGGELLDYLEVVGKAMPLKRPSIPWIAIPTTAGTGAEVTHNAVIAAQQYNRKVSLRSRLMHARLAVVDPQLTYGLPPDITAYTGMDALTQLVEAFVCTKANPITDAICIQGLGRLAGAIRAAHRLGDNPHARSDMCIASLLSGMALANAGLGLVHGLAGPLGGLLHAPHGAICGRLLGPVMQANILAMAGQDHDSPLLAKYGQMGQILTGKTNAGPMDAVQWVYQLTEDLQIAGLSYWGLKDTQIPEVADLALEASSTKCNPVRLDHRQVCQVLYASL